MDRLLCAAVSCSLISTLTAHAENATYSSENEWSSEDDEEEGGPEIVQKNFSEMFQEIIHEAPTAEKYLKLSRLAHDVSAPPPSCTVVNAFPQFVYAAGRRYDEFFFFQVFLDSHCFAHRDLWQGDHQRVIPSW